MTNHQLRSIRSEVLDYTRRLQLPLVAQPPRAEPAYRSLRDALPILLPAPGEVVILAGPVPELRSLLACVAVGRPPEDAVLLDSDAYAGPSLGDLIAAIGGGRDDPRDHLPEMLGAAEALAELPLSFLDDELPRGLPDGYALVVREHIRMAGGLPKLRREAQRTSARVLVPVPTDHGNDDPLLRHPDALRLTSLGPSYPSGRRHVEVSGPALGAPIRLAVSGRRFE